MKKFIMTKDQTTANVLIASGFKLVSEMSGVYTFLNAENHFNFNSIDSKKYCFTNILSI